MNHPSIPLHRIAILVFGTLSFFHAATYAAPGEISTVAGNGTYDTPADGSQAVDTGITLPYFLTTDSERNLFLSGDSRAVLRVDAKTSILTRAIGLAGPGDLGDGGPAIDAVFIRSQGIARDLAGNFYIADELDHRIRKVSAATGIIGTIAGDGNAAFTGDGGPATAAQVNSPGVLTIDTEGNIYFSDDNKTRVRRIDAETGIITTVAGTGSAGFSGDGGLAVDADFNLIRGLCFDSKGRLYICDSQNYRIRRLDFSTGIVDTVAGGGGSTAENTDALSFFFYYPFCIEMDSEDNLFVTVFAHDVVCKIDAETNKVTTVAGTRTGGFSGDGGPAAEAEIDGPRGLAIDAMGNLYFADSQNLRIRMVEAAAAPAVFQPDGAIGAKATSLKGNGLFSKSGAGQVLRIRGKKPKAKFFFQMNGNTYRHFYDTYRVQATGGNRDMKIKYLQTGAGNVTASLKSGSMTLEGEEAGGTIRFAARIKANRSARVAKRKFVIRAQSANDSSGADTLVAKVKVKNAN